MNELTRWDPFKDLEEVNNRLSNWLTRWPSLRRGPEQEAITRAEWAPAVDVSEDEKNYCVKVELPEMKRQDIKVSVENGVLSISGERKFEKEEKNKRHHRVERSYGSFVRSFTVPSDADASQVNANYKDGILTVNIAKSEKAKPREVEVKVT